MTAAQKAVGGSEKRMGEEAGRSRLGRGLAALIGDVDADSSAAAPVERSKTQRRLPVAFLRPNPRNPRKTIDHPGIAELAASVRQKGVVQPILVRPLPGHDEAYEIIAGERRWRAAQQAGVHDVPVVVLEVSDKEALELAIIENVQRTDLNPIEEAQGYQQLIDEHKYSQAELAGIIGKSRSHIANTLRLLALPEVVRIYMLDGRLTAGHARALLTLSDPAAGARRILREGLSVRQAEALADEIDPIDDYGRVRRPRGRKAAAAGLKDADTRALEKSLADALGLDVTVRHRAKGGEVRIRYRTLEQLDDIGRRLRRG